MILSHISFALSLIALVTGVSLYLWSVRAEMGPGIVLAKTFGVIVIVLAILDILGSIYVGVHWHRMNKLHHCNCPMNNAPGNTTNTNQLINQTPPNQPVDNQSLNNSVQPNTSATQQ